MNNSVRNHFKTVPGLISYTEYLFLLCVLTSKLSFFPIFSLASIGDNYCDYF